MQRQQTFCLEIFLHLLYGLFACRTRPYKTIHCILNRGQKMSRIILSIFTFALVLIAITSSGCANRSLFTNGSPSRLGTFMRRDQPPEYRPAEFQSYDMGPNAFGQAPASNDRRTPPRAEACAVG
jgi:hypothetical protein